MANFLAHGTGRRKKAVARVRIAKGKGNITVNGSDYKTYLPTRETQAEVEKPFAAIEAARSFDVSANVNGGGMTGQAKAICLGFSRALLLLDEENRKVLRASGLLTVDARIKERKKPGQPGARKKFQFVKR
jgi:small subunit ribosomal protein S9